MMSGDIYDASDPKNVSDAEKQQADKDLDLHAIMKTFRGRRWLYKLIFETCHMKLNSFNGTDHGTDYNEGARQVGVNVDNEIIARCGAEAYLQMMKENLQDE